MWKGLAPTANAVGAPISENGMALETMFFHLFGRWLQGSGRLVNHSTFEGLLHTLTIPSIRLPMIKSLLPQTIATIHKAGLSLTIVTTSISTRGKVNLITIHSTLT